MSAGNWHDKIVDYLYRDLSADELRGFEEALTKDAALREETETLRASMEEMRRLEKSMALPKLSAHVAERVMFAARTEADKNRKRAAGGAPWYSLQLWAMFSRPAVAYALSFLFMVSLTSFIVFQKNLVRIEVKHPAHEAVAAAPPAPVLMEARQVMPERLPTSLPESDAPQTQEFGDVALEAEPQPKSVAGAVARGDDLAKEKKANQMEVAAVAKDSVAPERQGTVVNLPLQTVGTGGGSYGAGAKARNEGPRLADALSVSEQLSAGNAFFSRRNYVMALAYYRNVTSLAPASYEAMVAYHQSARAYVKSHNWNESRRMYDHLLGHYPGYRHFGEALLESGRLHALQREPDKALEEFRLCSERYPEMKRAAQSEIDGLKSH